MMEQQVLKELFLVLYGAVAASDMIACLYLLFRRANAIAPGVTSPLRLRRWAAAFFAATGLSHLWNLPVFFSGSRDDAMLSYLIGGLLDCMTVGPLAIALLIVMLQDRRRPLWPVALMALHFAGVMALCVAGRSDELLPVVYASFIVLLIGLVVYMVRALREYGGWLRDNYADLEHKEVWQSFVVLAAILSGLGLYTFDIEGLTYETLIQLINAVLIVYLLWRVETLSDLTTVAHGADAATATAVEADDHDHTLSIRNSIGPLLKQHCEDAQLYLQYDISVAELARRIGTNRLYLSRHFAMQGTTYNAYINGLRVRHFTALYREAAASHQTVTVQQLAHQSGFRSYATFNAAFKQSMGMTATAWMIAQRKAQTDV